MAKVELNPSPDNIDLRANGAKLEAARIKFADYGGGEGGRENPNASMPPCEPGWRPCSAQEPWKQGDYNFGQARKVVQIHKRYMVALCITILNKSVARSLWHTMLPARDGALCICHKWYRLVVACSETNYYI